MGELVSLDQQRPHLAGTGFCLECRHEWEAVAPIGVVGLECPKCGTHKGTMKGLVYPADDMVIHCKCDNPFYFITPEESVECAYCGIPYKFE